MAYDGNLVARVREVMRDLPGYTEKQMFGGVGFMLYGNMAGGVNEMDLIIRVGPDRYEAALAEPHTKPFDMTGRPMRGWVVVTPEGYAAEEDLNRWVRQGVDHALTLPSK